jgi:putative oxidoreductase
VIDKLEKRGLVKLERSKEDRRFYAADLTPAGRRMIRSVFPRHVAMVAKEMNTLTSGEQEELSRLCNKQAFGEWVSRPFRQTEDSMLKKLFQTEDDTATLILRVLLGVVFFPHGMQKLLGWFGGYGFSGTYGFFTGSLGIPAIFAVLAILAEGLGSLGLLTGLLTRIAAFGITVNMTVAVLMIHHRFGFFMNWNGKQPGEGIEFHLLVIAIGIALMIRGGGKWSVDRAITGKMK